MLVSRVETGMTSYKLHNILFTLMVLFVRFSDEAEMHLSGSSYIKFDIINTQSGTTPAISETVSLQFKTFHPNGLLFYAHGTTGQYISLELAEGKLRYTVNMGGSSKEKPYSLTFADGLCDNAWHSVRIIRDHRKLYLHFDGYQKNIDIKEPRFQNRNTLLLDFEYYVGGSWKSTNEYGNAIAKNFVGCLSDVLFNAFHSISEVRRNVSGYDIEGNVTFNCPPSTYEPITFTNNKAVLKIPTAHAQHKVSVSFSFRTYDRDGVLMYRDGNKASVHLYLKDAKPNFEFRVGDKDPVRIDTSTFIHQDLNDGAWHTVRASVDAHFMYLKIDDWGGVNVSGHAVELYGETSLNFENATYIGGGVYHRGMHGFVGCMRDLRANGVAVDLKRLTQPRGIYSQSVAKGRCALRSFCHPNPCRHESACVQRSGNYTCECKRFYEGRFCEQPLFQATCQRYKELGMTEDARCTVDPDNAGPLPEFRVLCNMTAGQEAVTVVEHTRGAGTTRVSNATYHSAASKLWIHFINYGVDYEPLRALVDESDRCRQYVQFDCINTTFLTKQANGRSGAMWSSNDAISRYYWGGGRDTNSECACARTGSCHDRTKVCNCDTGDGVWRRDAGYITEKSHLPVVRMFFPESANLSNFTLGPLECFGRKKKLTREAGERKYFDVACQPIATTPPPVYPWRTAKSRTTTVKQSMKSSTSTSDHPTTISSTRVVEEGGLSSGNVNTVNASIVTTEPSKHTSPATTVVSSKNTSLHPVDPTSNTRVEGVKDTNWVFIVVVAGSSLLVFIALFFLLVIVRHKRANGVWCTGLFAFSSCVKPQQLPKIEIYRHSMGTDAPDILHLEDFKNTKVVDLRVHRGHFVANNKPKKMVTFKNQC